MIPIKEKIEIPAQLRKSKFKNKGLSITMNPQNRQKLDRILNQDYRSLRTNPNHGIMSCGICSHNPLIMEYIRDIYTEYQLQNPLEINAIHRPNAETRRPKIVSPVLQTPTKRAQQTVNNTTFEVQSIRRTRRASQIYSPNMPSRVYVDAPLSHNKVKQAYRYCIACERPIIEANIQSHESQCLQFQKVYQMDIQKVYTHLEQKINKIKQKLKNKSQSLLPNDSKQFQKYINFAQKRSQVASFSVKDTQFLNYYNQAMQLGIKWGQASQQLSKLRWFMKVKQQVRNYAKGK